MLGAGALFGLSAVAGCLGSRSRAVDRERATATPTMGDADAPVTVAVFVDFACPHCREFDRNVVPKLRTNYVEPGKVVLEHHDFPLPVDETASWRAPSAARSVLGRTDSATFFEYADGLFANQASLGPELYADLAAEVDVDADAVRSAATEERYRDAVAADREEGVDRGVGGTPTVFVDGENAADHGRLGYTGIAQRIDERL